MPPETTTKDDVQTVSVTTNEPRPGKAPRTSALREQLLAEEAKLEALLKPAREVYDKLINDPKLLAAQKTIREVSAALAPIKDDLAQLARAAGSKGIKIEPGKLTPR